MCGSRTSWQRLRARLVGGLVVPGLLAVVSESRADGPVLLPPAETHTSPALSVPLPAVQVLDLAACRALAMEKQPAIAAARSSLAAAVARQHALENLCVPTFLQRDLPTRRKQAALGVTVAQAGVLQAEIDTIYAVQFAYLSFQYATTQNRLVENIRQQLELLRTKLGEINSDETTLARVEALRLLVGGRQAEAAVGAERALSSLREAVGVEGCWLLAQDLGGLPSPLVAPDCKEVVELALARRPEIVQAATGAQVTDLEICAQQARRLSLTVWTFAAGSDIHANLLPTPVYGPGYRPGAVGPEMPVTLNGKRSHRVEQAQIYNGRALNVLEKTQNLLRLETEQAFLRWKEASARVASYQLGVTKAQKALPDLVDKMTIPRTPANLTSYLDTARLLTDLRVELNRARYDQLLALIAVERATAGGFCAGLDKAPIAPDLTRRATKGPENGGKTEK